MQRKGLSLIIIYGFLITSLGMSFISLDIPDANGYDPFFTLTAVASADNPLTIDYLNFARQYLHRLGINLNVIVLDSTSSIFENFDADICYFEYEKEKYPFEPDFSDLYSESGTRNVFGYDSDIDYNSTLGMGTNEYYLEQGKQIFPPNSNERETIYANWEENLFNEILPGLPAFSPNIFSIGWNGLEGYEISKGLLQSFGNLRWKSDHSNQINQEEIVISDKAWGNLNPLIHPDDPSKFISDAILDPLFRFDYDASYWPHLGTNIEILSDTHFRIHTREGIKWQTDPDNLFPNENFDVDDVYFSLYAWKNLSIRQADFQWIDSMEKISSTAIDIFVTENPDFPNETPPFDFLSKLTIPMLPEHYLNQTQILDEKTPDTSHSSWTKFALNCFGTGMFKLTNFIEGEETILSLSNSYWGLNDSIISDSLLNYRERFGLFDGSITQLRVKVILDETKEIQELESGTIDLIEDSNYTQLSEMNSILEFTVQQKPSNKFGMFGFNLRPCRPVIGNLEAAPGDSRMTGGLAIRNAIYFAIDLDEINDVIHNGAYYINHHYLPTNLENSWYKGYLRTGIDLDLAKDYMAIAGYEWDLTTYGHSGFEGLYLVIVLLLLSPLICCIVIVTAVVAFKDTKDSKITTTKQKIYYCYHCQESIKRDSEICPKCHKEIPHCAVCSLPIEQMDFIGKCSHCGKAAHLTHLLEWLKVKGYCPNCSLKLSDTEIVIEGYKEDVESLD